MKWRNYDWYSIKHSVKKIVSYRFPSLGIKKKKRKLQRFDWNRDVFAKSQLGLSLDDGWVKLI